MQFNDGEVGSRKTKKIQEVLEEFNGLDLEMVPDNSVKSSEALPGAEGKG